MMIQRWTALVLGAGLVAIAKMLGHFNLATPIPFWLLSPGILAGACVPGSGFNPEGDVQPWSPLSVFVFYAANIALYSGLTYLVISPLRGRFLPVK
jgi:hypothetical protein